MSPYRSNDRGTLTLRITFAGIGRIRKASGTHSPATLARMKDMLRALATDEPPRVDVLEAIRDGVVKPMEAYRLYKAKGLKGVRTAATVLPMEATMVAWADAMKKGSDEWKRKRKIHYRMVARFAKPSRMPRGREKAAPPSLADLPAAIRAYRAHCERQETFVAFNRARGAIQGYLKDAFGIHHWLYRDLQEVQTFEETPPPGKGVAPEVFKAKMATVPDPYRRMAWELACTGMGWKEYAHDGWEVGKGFVAIHGQKRKQRERIVPLLIPIQGPTSPSQRTERKLRAALNEVGLSNYGLRHIYHHWLGEAGINPSRIDYYSGHKPKTMSDHYQRHDVMPYLERDATKLRDLIQPEVGALRAVK